MATRGPSLPESLPPHDLRNAMRRTLKAALDRFDSDEFLDALEAMPEEERSAAQVSRGEVYRAWRKLNNLQLDKIRDKLVQNEPALRSAIEDLDRALADLSKVTKVLDTTNKALSVAIKILDLL